MATTDFAIDNRYTLLRSYIKGVGDFAEAGGSIDLNARGFTINAVYAGLSYHTVAVFKPEFWAWSSNTYTPDWIIEDYYNYFDIDPGHRYPINVTQWGVKLSAPFHNWYLSERMYPNAVWYSVDLPAAPPDYWSPLPP